MAKRPRYEGSKADEAKDRRQAKRRGMTLAQWEGSAADRREDMKGQKALDRKAKRKRRK